MTRQEIREGVAQGIRLGICAYQHLGFDNAEMYNKIADEILKRLHAQRVVIKADRELPEWLKFKWANNPCITSQDDVDKAFTFDIVEDAGFVFTEPLVEGEV